MKNARGHILLLHQKGSSPLGLQPLNKYCFLRNHVLACRKYSFQGNWSVLQRNYWRFREFILGLREFMLFLGDSWILLLLQDSQLFGFRNSGMEKGFWEGGCSGRMERNANPPLYISQSQASRKHITGFQKTLPTLQKTPYKSPESIFQKFPAILF